jgi:hypothetical protein
VPARRREGKIPGVWYPLKLERLTLATRLSPDECRERLAHTTSPWLAFQYTSLLPVRGFVRQRRFYFGPRKSTRALLKTWISGQIRKVEQMTVIDVAIGPNRITGLFLTALLVMLALGAAVATVLAFTSPFQTGVGAVFSWVVVAAFVAVFFVFPAEDHPRERAFLLEHVKKTLEATPREGRR